MTPSLTLLTLTLTLTLTCFAHSADPGTQVVDLGLYLLRGDNIAIVGELDTVLGAQ